MQLNRNMIVNGNGGVLPIGKETQQVAQTAQTPETANFRSVMESVSANTRTVQFSKHANMRLDARNIHLDGEQLRRVEDGIARAQGKGIRDSLVLVDNIALVVNITNKVVVTALSQQDQVFTNIDGAVIV